jgi:hypothetical protein
MSAVAKLQAVLGMDASEFKAGIKGASKDASSFQSQIKKVGAVIAGAFSVGAIISAGKSLASWAGNVSEAAQNAGVLTSEMMALNEVALKGGLGVDEMRRMLSKLQTELTDAAGGNETARKKFESLGLSITDLSAMDPMSMFRAVSKAAFETGQPLQHLADIFGDKLGPKAVSALRDLAENGLPLIDQAAADAADQIENLGDKWDAFIEKLKRGAASKISTTIDFFSSEEVRAKAEEAARKVEKEKASKQQRVSTGTASPYASFGADVSASMTPESQKRIKDAGEAAVQQWWADKRAKEEKDRADKAAQQQATKDANAALAKQAEKDRAQKAYMEQFVAETGGKGTSKDAFGKDINGNYDDYFKRIGETSRAERSTAEKNARLQEQLQSLTATGPVQMNTDAMARVGGFFGGDRAGLDVQSKQLQVQQESRRIQEEMNQNIIDLGESIRNMNGVGNG